MMASSPNVRPRQAQQIAEPQAGRGGQIDRVRNLGSAGFLDAGNVGIGPDDLRAIGRCRVLDALAWIAGDLAERIDRMRQHAR